MTKFPKVDKEACIGCGACASVCPAGVFEMQDGKSVVVNPHKCTGCKACIEACPVEAIKLVEGKK